jgi:hypothetical protein
MRTELTGWTFHMEEVSTGVYKLIGTHRAGYSVQATGGDLEALIMRVKKEAFDLESRVL